jgi:uncharacterized protein (DUF2147 family)
MSAMLLAALAIGASAPEGTFVTEDGSALVRIEPCGSSLCGTVARILSKGPGIPVTDVHNPDRRLRSRPLLGLAVLGGFKPSGGQWTGGRIYDPKSGKTYRSTLSVNADGSLKVSGCVLFICQTQRWRPQP